MNYFANIAKSLERTLSAEGTEGASGGPFTRKFGLNIKRMECGKLLSGHSAAISACGAYRDERTGRLVIVTGSWDKTLRL